MWRAAVLACGLWAAQAPLAAACIVDAALEGIAFYDAIPANLTDDQLAIDVQFDEDEVHRPNGVVTARVRRVLHGAYGSDTVRVVLDNSSCSRSFLFGHEGIIVGVFVSPLEPPPRVEAPPVVVGTARRVREPVPLPDDLVLSWPVNETVFVPEIETLQERRQRGGSVPFVPEDRVFRVDELSAQVTPFTWFDESTRTLREGVMGDFDGDGRADRAGFAEGADRTLVITVERHAGSRTTIWSGDISSRPYFTLRSVPPGTFRTMCHLYDGCGSTVPEQVTLAYDALIVTALEGSAEFLYYWDGAAFQNIIVAE